MECVSDWFRPMTVSRSYWGVHSERFYTQDSIRCWGQGFWDVDSRPGSTTTLDFVLTEKFNSNFLYWNSFLCVWQEIWCFLPEDAHTWSWSDILRGILGSLKSQNYHHRKNYSQNNYPPDNNPSDKNIPRTTPSKQLALINNSQR